MTDIKNKIEEEARVYVSNELEKNGFRNFHGCECVEKAFIKGSNFILSKWQEANRWRKVSEELPDKPCEVLVMDSDECMYIAYFNYGKFILDRYTQINGDIREWKQID